MDGSSLVQQQQVDERSGDDGIEQQDKLSKSDTSLSFLIELKIYPFQEESMMDKKRVAEESSDNGSVAFGVNLEVPGSQGFGYGEEWPLKSLIAPKSMISRWISFVNNNNSSQPITTSYTT